LQVYCGISSLHSTEIIRLGLAWSMQSEFSSGFELDGNGSVWVSCVTAWPTLSRLRLEYAVRLYRETGYNLAACSDYYSGAAKSLSGF
jgi:hypothetical protein